MDDGVHGDHEPFAAGELGDKLERLFDPTTLRCWQHLDNRERLLIGSVLRLHRMEAIGVPQMMIGREKGMILERAAEVVNMTDTEPLTHEQLQEQLES